MKRYCNDLLKAAALILACAVVGTLLLYLAYLLPTEPMKAHVRESMPLYTEEWEFFEWADSGDSRLDLQTDILMLGGAVYSTEESTLQQVMVGGSPTYGEEWKLEALQRYLDGEEGHTPYFYPRYWKGFLVVLKPLLLVFTPAQLRTLGMYLQPLLVLWLLYLMLNKLGKWPAAAMAAALLTMNPVSVIMCFQYQTSFYVTLAACLAVMLCPRLREEKNCFAFFVLIGCATVFFDYLTYPIITLAMPILLVLLLNHSRYQSVVREIVDFFWLCIGWALGYGGLWVAKWGLATAVTGKNVFKDAADRVQYRMSGDLDWAEVTPLNAILRTVGTLLSPALLVLAAVLAAVLIVQLARRKIKLNFQWQESLLLAGLSMIPFAWFVAVANHSINHRYFTYRSLAATVFAWLMILVINLKKTDEK